METLRLGDDTQLVVRPIRPSDKEALLAGFERLSDESRRRRFLAPKKVLTRAELRYLTEIDHRSHEALVVIDVDSGRRVAVARYAAYVNEPWRSEFAITVADDWQGRGVGGALARRLLARAREEGVPALEASVLAENHAARALLAGLGFTVCTTRLGVTELSLPLSRVEQGERRPPAPGAGRVGEREPPRLRGEATARAAAGWPSSLAPGADSAAWSSAA